MCNKILIIDDYLPLLNSLRIVLELNQYQVEISQNTACLQAEQRILPDILLVDHHIPGEDDPNWLQKLKNTPRFNPIPIILMSGDLDIEKIAPDTKADDFILKPINIGLLLDKINLLLYPVSAPAIA